MPGDLPDVDPVLVGLVGNRLYSILSEQQTALVNTAFSPVVRESLDLACAVFDSRGAMIGQSVGGTPGHINAMATGMRHVASTFSPEQLEPGDVLVTNDPWMTAGQVNDITVATPVFSADRLVGWFASCCHSPDIGGRILSAAANDVYEEGLRLPITKLVSAGRLDERLLELIRANVRTPDETVGDIHAQIAGNAVGGRSLLRLMDEFGLTEIDAVAAQIMRRSEDALRTAIGEVADGTYRGELRTDGFGEETLDLRVTVHIRGQEIDIDFAGSSAQSRYGINVVLNYTRAYASFAVKAAIAPDVPHNAGSFRPVHVSAPRGSVLNCLPPAPVASRHLVGHFLPSLLFTALQPVLGDRLLAPSADALWMAVWRGQHAAGDESFTLTTFHAGGSGGRAGKDGLSATGFPTGVRAAPTEVLETITPLVHRRRTLRRDSAGAGLHRGGLGQVVEVANRAALPWTVNGNVDRTRFPASGVAGGRDGTPGAFELTAGAELPRKQLVHLAPGDVVRLSLPGGGGNGDPRRRPVEQVVRDVVDGYISTDTARDVYGVAVVYEGRQDALVRPPAAYRLDEEVTARLREGY